eukprot:10672314-Ditylum_brightwellii.AAC.1
MNKKAPQDGLVPETNYDNISHLNNEEVFTQEDLATATPNKTHGKQRGKGNKFVTLNTHTEMMEKTVKEGGEI